MIRQRRSIFVVATILLMVFTFSSLYAMEDLPAWGMVDSPNQGTRDNALYGIAVLDKTDVWAVGEWNPNVVPTETGRRTLIQHWDGNSWGIIPSPDPAWSGLDLATLENVAAVAVDDVWAVGYAEDFASLKSTTLIEHWNGNSWSIVPSPNPAGDSLPNRLYDIAAVAADDIWAVGESGYPQKALFLHYDGTSWVRVLDRCRAPMQAVSAVGQNIAWAVGGSTACRYNGTEWRRTATPQPEGTEAAFIWNDVSIISRNDAWAVGLRITPYFSGYIYQSLVMHWNGQEWTVDRNIPGQTMNSVIALAADNVWAAGTDGANSLILHYDGASWQAIPTPQLVGGGFLQTIDALDNNSLWAAGLFYSDDGHYDEQTLVMNAPSLTSGGVVGDTNVAFATISWIGQVNGSTTTNSFGEYQAAGLPAGEYTFIASAGGCSPDVAAVTILAGQTITQDFIIDC